MERCDEKNPNRNNDQLSKEVYGRKRVVSFQSGAPTCHSSFYDIDDDDDDDDDRNNDNRAGNDSVRRRYNKVETRSSSTTWYSSEELRRIRRRDAKLTRRIVAMVNSRKTSNSTSGASSQEGEEFQELRLRSHGIETPQGRKTRKTQQETAWLNVLSTQDQLWTVQQQERHHEQQAQHSRQYEHDDESYNASQIEEILAQTYARDVHLSVSAAYERGLFCEQEVQQQIFEETLNAKIDNLKKLIADIHVDNKRMSSFSSTSSFDSSCSSKSSDSDSSTSSSKHCNVPRRGMADEASASRRMMGTATSTTTAAAANQPIIKPNRWSPSGRTA